MRQWRPDQPVPSLASTAQSLRELVVAAVDELCALLSGHDAFDVMTMLRQYLVPPDLSHWRESETKVEGSWACAEIVALALLGMGFPTRSASNSKRTVEIIPEVVARAAHLLQLSDIDAVGALAGGQHSELSRVAWMLRTYETNVRGRQYTSIADRINDALLRRPRAAEIWTNELGYDLDDVLQVRAAIATICSSAYRANLDQLQRLAEIDPAEIDEIGRQAVITLIETPSDLYTLTVDQVADQSGISVTTVRAILNQFSIAANGGTAQDLVTSLIRGRNPMAGKAILRRDNSYLVLPGAIAPGEVRRTCESQLKPPCPSWTSYDRQRKAGSEELTTKAIAQLTHGHGRRWANLEYRAPTSNKPGVDLSAQSTTSGDAELVESDLLLVLDGVALCVEVKAGDVRSRTRQGGLLQLTGDLEKTIKEAGDQADRLRSLITTHHCLWLKGGIWLDLSDVEEVHCIAVTVDDFGPVLLMMEQLVRAGTLTQTELPWIVGLHDLLVTADVLDEPSQFLTYLRRRTNRDASLWVTAADELDVLMWFVGGDFYFQADPDRLFALRPQDRPPTAKQRRTYSEQGRTAVGTFTDDLDAWYYWQEGSSSVEAECPRRQMDPALRAICDQLRQVQHEGWYRTGSDLDGLSAQAQRQLADAIRTTIQRTTADHKLHSCRFGGTDDTGRWRFIVVADTDATRGQSHLQSYVKAAKHNDGADRALGVLLSPDGSLLATAWNAHPPGPDATLDHLVHDLRLVPPDRLPRVLPPHVRNPRLAGKTKRRKRK